MAAGTGELKSIGWILANTGPQTWTLLLTFLLLASAYCATLLSMTKSQSINFYEGTLSRQARVRWVLTVWF